MQYYPYKWKNKVVSFRFLINNKLSKTFINPRVVQNQNEQNSESQINSSDRELSEYCYLDLYRKLNSSKHLIHCFTE